MAGARFAVFVGEAGVERIVPAGTGLAETEAGMRLYRRLRTEIAQFDQAIRQRLDAFLDVEVPLKSSGVN